MQNTERFIFIENSIVLISTEEEIVMKQGMKTKKKEPQGIFKKWLLGLVLVGVITAGACGQSSTQPAESVPAAAAETTIADEVAT